MGAGVDFQSTEGWRLALVFFVFITISLILEKALHRLHHFFHKTKRLGLTLTLKAMEEELMILGFISLSLIGFEDAIMTICVPLSISQCGASINECGFGTETGCGKVTGDYNKSVGSVNASGRRQLGGGGGDGYQYIVSVQGDSAFCGGDPNLAPFIEPRALHECHIFIFVFAMVHLLYNTVNMRLCLRKVDTWEEWHTGGVKLLNDTLQAKTPRPQNGDSETPAEISAAPSMFNHMTQGLDLFVFLVLRKVFQVQHDLPADFNFHKYIKWSTGKEFSKAVGMTWWMWAITIAYVFADTLGISWLHVAIPLLALALSVACGLKLSFIALSIAKTAWSEIDEDDNGALDEEELMQLDYSDTTLSDRGLWVAASSSPRAGTEESFEKEDQRLLHDGLFWFGDPRIMLRIVHFTMFQNGLTLAYMVFYGLMSGKEVCYMNHMGQWLWVMLFLVVAQLIHSSVVTLPLFSIISQMSDTLDTQIIDALEKEHANDVTKTDALVGQALNMLKKPSPRPSSESSASSQGEGSASPSPHHHVNLVLKGTVPGHHHSHTGGINPIHHSDGEKRVRLLRQELVKLKSMTEQIEDALRKEEHSLGPRALANLDSSDPSLEQASPKTRRTLLALGGDEAFLDDDIEA